MCLKKFSVKRFVLLFVAFVSVCIGSCDSTNSQKSKIAVLSDVHLFNMDLLVADGSAFQSYFIQNRRLIKESTALIEAAVNEICNNDEIKIVLFSGDLTKDGEKINHESLIEHLNKLESAGKKVYVLPGNHDIMNPHAKLFDGDTTQPVESIDAEMFKTLYDNFGYNEAIATDPNSLSYIVEPSPDLWIVVMDSCEYENNPGLSDPDESGRFSDETLQWIVQNLQTAQVQQKKVLGMTHHSIIEHYEGQSVLFPDYVLDDYNQVTDILADNGMNIVFSGDDHSVDIVKKETASENYIYDIETGALVTFPCSYRVVHLNNSTLRIETKYIKEIDYDLNDSTSLQEYAFGWAQVQTYNKVVSYLVNGKIVINGNPIILPKEKAEEVAPLFVASTLAHYAGDEQPDEETLAVINNLLNSTDPLEVFLGEAVLSRWTDLYPGDNNIVIDLNSGNIIE